MMNESNERVYGFREHIPVTREVKPSKNLLLNIISKHPEVNLVGINAIYVGSKHEHCSCEQCGGESRVSYWMYVYATPHVQTVIEKILEGFKQWGKVTNESVRSRESVIQCIKGTQAHGDGEYFTEYAAFECNEK